jgi:hypothetical protein
MKTKSRFDRESEVARLPPIRWVLTEGIRSDVTFAIPIISIRA